MVINLNCAAVLKKFDCHKEVKEKLLSMINESWSYRMTNDSYGDNINRLDWSENTNFDREWVKFIKPKLEKHFNECAKSLNYENCNINGIWYQQYIKEDTHTWHIHGENYTGVYYLELPENSSKTELLDQIDINKKITINAKEGDVVIFPSFIIHRSPKIVSNIKKTIISFNLNFSKIRESILPFLNNNVKIM
jgi:hypothetical protein